MNTSLPIGDKLISDDILFSIEAGRRSFLKYATFHHEVVAHPNANQVCLLQCRYQQMEDSVLTAQAPAFTIVEAVEEVADRMMDSLLLDAAQELSLNCSQICEHLYDHEFFPVHRVVAET